MHDNIAVPPWKIWRTRRDKHLWQPDLMGVGPWVESELTASRRHHLTLTVQKAKRPIHAARVAPRRDLDGLPAGLLRLYRPTGVDNFMI